MNISEHLDKGIWTAADKALLLLYGFAVIVFVVNLLPATEWGAFVIFQTIFLILCVLSDSIFLQPMVKFASEHEAEVQEVLAASFNLYSGFMLVLGGVVALFSKQLASIFSSPEVGIMLPYLPVLIALNIFRNVGIRYLQVFYKIHAIFWVDLAFYGSIILLAILANVLGVFHTGVDFLWLNMIGGGLSSLVAFIFARKAYLSMPLFSVPGSEYQKLLSFAKFQSGTSTLLTLQQWSDQLIVGMFYGPTVVALYANAKNLYRFLDAVREGATLLIVPVSSKLYTSRNFDGLAALIEKILFGAFAGLVPVSLILTIIANPLFHIIYKGKYDAAAPVFQILMLSGFTLPLSLISTNVLIGMGKAKSLFLSTLGATIIFFGLSFILSKQMGPLGEGLAVFISMTVLALLTFIAMRKELNVSPAGIMRRAGEAKQFVMERAKGFRKTIEATPTGRDVVTKEEINE